MFSPKTLELIRERISLAELAGESVQLKRAGRQLMGLCPFHSEKSPSFSVNDEEGVFYCFGCGKKGSLFDYVMETKGLSFPEAVRFLGARAGVEIESETPQAERVRKEQTDHKRTLRVITHSAADIFREYLLKDQRAKRARDYLASRGVSSETGERFLLGYFPSNAEEVIEKISKVVRTRVASIEEDKILAAYRELGLLRAERIEGEKSLYSAFHDRLIFPITRSDGVPIAFGGRILEAESERPKYLNSSESPIYLKRQTFYGLSQALTEIRRLRKAILVEGYLDVLSLTQAGWLNVIATCGTAVSTEHVRVLSRLVDRVVVVFDGDRAGQKAAASCFPVFLNSGIELEMLSLPEGQDPSSLIEHSGLEASGSAEFEKLFDTARRPLVDAYIEELLHQAGADPETSTAATAKAARQFASMLQRVKNPVECELLCRRAATPLGVSSEALEALVRGEKKQSPKSSESVERATNAVRTGQRQQPPKQAPKQFGQNVWRPKARAAHPVAPSRATLNGYLDQVLVAVVSEPQLAKVFLGEISILSGREVDDESVLAKVNGFITEIAKLQSSEAGLSGVADAVNQLDWEGEAALKPEFLTVIEKLLVRFGFDAGAILAEARSQVSIGGGKPERVVGDAKRVTSHISLRDEIEQIKREEVQDSASEDLVGVVQRKLEAKRNLEKLRKDGPG